MQTVFNKMERGEVGWEVDNPRFSQTLSEHKWFLCGLHFFNVNLDTRQTQDTARTRDSKEVEEFLALPSTIASLVAQGRVLKSKGTGKKAPQPKVEDLTEISRLVDSLFARRASQSQATWQVHSQPESELGGVVCLAVREDKWETPCMLVLVLCCRGVLRTCRQGVQVLPLPTLFFFGRDRRG